MTLKKFSEKSFLLASALSSNDVFPLSQEVPMEDICDIKPMIPLAHTGISPWVWIVAGGIVPGLLLGAGYFVFPKKKKTPFLQSHLQRAEILREKLRYSQKIPMEERYHVLGMMLRFILVHTSMPQALALTLEEIHRHIMNAPEGFAFKEDVEAFIRELGEIEYGGVVPEEKDFLRDRAMMENFLERELAKGSPSTKEGL